MPLSWLSDSARARLTQFVLALVDQQAARTIVAPDEPKSGFWFGGGNVIQDSDGSLLLVGRYRSGGDSRTGIKAGTRGRELTLFRSDNGGDSFDPLLRWDKQALSASDADVLSIEGACLAHCGDEYRLYVSTEKETAYPADLADYQKPGAGVWSIDLLRAPTLQDLQSAAVEPVLSGTDPSHLHLKDPFLWPAKAPADLVSDASYHLGFCSHPFGWSSSNSGIASLNPAGTNVEGTEHCVLQRGTTWDVAMTRATCVLPVPRVGEFADRDHTLIFYCGGECLRPLEEHGTAVNRPRGYSCEEIGGAAVYVDGDLRTAVRLSDVEPLFVSPWGTGCSRYVDVLATPDGFLSTWQQSQQNESQPLVAHRLSRDAAESALSAVDHL